MAKAWIGTSGWAYRHWRSGVFYPEDLKGVDQLTHYASVFDCVELNSTFYHTPRETTIRTWVERTPSGFLFAYKGSRVITHLRRLREVEEPTRLVMSRAALLGEKLGPILWQFPPGFHYDPDRLVAFLRLLPPGHRYAFEFRHQSWFQEPCYELLRQHKATLVWADTPRYPLVKEITADFVYARLHGHEVLYASCYTEAQLEEWAADFRHALQQGRDVFVFFDNDAEGYAPHNALALREILLRPRGRRRKKARTE
ncbi:MAG: DUF72 domain-containing protein [Armatimonadetes bacterium]|nr:DUF72 domain-containing protein [Armatimonadota bacterium]